MGMLDGLTFKLLIQLCLQGEDWMQLSENRCEGRNIQGGGKIGASALYTVDCTIFTVQFLLYTLDCTMYI